MKPSTMIYDESSQMNLPDIKMHQSDIKCINAKHHEENE